MGRPRIGLRCDIAIAPLDDIRYPPAYRRDVARAMVRRALEEAAR